MGDVPIVKEVGPFAYRSVVNVFSYLLGLFKVNT